MQDYNEIWSAINKTKVEDNFYKTNEAIAMTPGEKISLYEDKKGALAKEYGSGGSKNNLSYPLLKKLIESNLSKYSANKGKLKGIDTTFKINLHNIQTLL